MILQRKLQQLMLVWVIASVVAAAPASSQTIRPDCQANCGDVTIPYPFGTKDGCYLNQDFLVTCNSSSFSPPRLFLWNSNIPVLEISLSGQLRILNIVANVCYNQQGQEDLSWKSFTLLPRFPFSVKLNKFTAVGCNALAVIQGSNGQSYATGCLSLCDSIDSVTNGSCSGIGCCQTAIPRDLLNYNVSVESVGNRTGIWDFNPCSYAFLVEDVYYNFSLADLRNLQNRTAVPAVLDWAVGEETCAQAKNSAGYACPDQNSFCSESDNGPGYLCNCSPGYQGNPYLPNGCQDINECADPNLNRCKKNMCINTPGNYTCACPKGYHGDGREDGEGCTADQALVVKIAIGVSTGLIGLLIVGSWLYWGFKKRKLIKLKEKFFQQNGGLMLQQQLFRQDRSTETVKIFSTEELEKATNNYDESRIIGRGGYGTVYRGILADNRIVAIKKSRVVDQSQIEQFINEVVVLSQINHRNVVKLLGCCLETEVPLLVYEFVTNGTLFEHIHNENKASAISWKTRLKIAAETAGVLSYLHSAASPPIIHRDVKSTNILLDDNYIAKVSDFGASRLVPLDQTQLSTLVQGTIGYLDPEYLHTSQLTEKSDVYSFGVVLAELLTGKKAVSFNRPEEERSLAMYFVSSLKEDRLFEVLESHIVNEENSEQLMDVAKLVKRCLRVTGEERPTMKEVAMELEGLRMTVKHPWNNVELNSQETEYLLVETSDSYRYSGSSRDKTAGYDSIRDHVILPLELDDGR